MIIALLYCKECSFIFIIDGWFIFFNVYSELEQSSVLPSFWLAFLNLFLILARHRRTQDAYLKVNMR